MKLNQPIILLLAATAMSVPVLAGCASSSVQEISLNIDAQPETLVVVMPFAAAKERFAMSDAAARGLGGVAIESKTGIYTYRFDDKDYANLRKSIIESFQKDGSFKGVQDVSHDTEIGAGTKLYVNFTESGMGDAGWGGFTCTISAYAWTEDVTGNVLAKKEIAVVEKSMNSVGGAKNKAIIKFVREVSELFVTNQTLTNNN